MFEFIDAIHFLRPGWFLALLPVAWLIWRAWQVNKKQGAWHQVIDPKFRKLLLGENSSEEPSLNEKIAYFGLGIAWFFAILALSGPWIKSVEIPAQKSQQGVVVVLDLSLSMLADDVSPNRLSRVKYGLVDVVEQNPDFSIGMVAYAGSAHTITPISEDNKTLLSLLPSLNPVLMPQFGSDPLEAMQLAKRLLEGANITQGHLIWITDDIEPHQMKPLTTWFNSNPYSVHVLSIGTNDGGVVQIPNYGLLKDDDDKLILPKVPLHRFQTLEDDTAIDWTHFQIGTDYSDALMPPKLMADHNKTEDGQDDSTQAERDKEVQHPLDIGIYSVFILLPLVAFIFRRGVLLTLMTTLVLPVSMLAPDTSYANSDPDSTDEKTPLTTHFGDIFLTHDQLGYQAWQANDFATAENLFKHPQWRASALYKQANYKEAAKLFETDTSATGLYNYGNALAQNMELDSAIQAYEQALMMKPDWQQAKDNLALVKQLKSMMTDDQNAVNDQTQQQNQQNTDNPSTDQPKDSQGSEGSEGSKGNENSEDHQSQAQQPDSQPSDRSTKETPQDAQQNDRDSPQEQAEKHNENSASSPTEQQDGDSPADTPEDTEQGNTDQKNSEQNGLQKETQSDTDSDPSEDETRAMRRLTDSDEAMQDPMTEQEQAQQNWLKQIPDQPGLFLKQKFEYQYQQNPRADQQSQKQW